MWVTARALRVGIPRLLAVLRIDGCQEPQQKHVGQGASKLHSKLHVSSCLLPHDCSRRCSAVFWCLCLPEHRPEQCRFNKWARSQQGGLTSSSQLGLRAMRTAAATRYPTAARRRPRPPAAGPPLLPPWPSLRCTAAPQQPGSQRRLPHAVVAVRQGRLQRAPQRGSASCSRPTAAAAAAQHLPTGRQGAVQLPVLHQQQALRRQGRQRVSLCVTATASAAGGDGAAGVSFKPLQAMPHQPMLHANCRTA